VSSGRISQYIVCSDVKTCLCYASKLAPINDKTYPNKAAMCFDTQCTNDVLTLFDITESDCKNHDLCNEVYDWVTNSQSSNPDTLDKDKYERFCPNITPPNIDKYNINVLVLCIFYTVLSSTFVFLVCKNKKYETFTTFLMTFITLLVFSFITYFLCRFLIGDYLCDKNTLHCYSRFYGNNSIVIPSEFCNASYKPNCECVFDQNCGEQCRCQSGLCVNKNSKRESHIVNQYNFNYTLIISSLLLSILFPLLFVYASSDYDWHIDKKMYIIIITLLSIIPLLYMIVKTMKKVPVTVYDPITCN
jgi:hypothetical protein